MEKEFTEPRALTLIGALIQSGSIKMIGSSNNPEVARHNAKSDALYLKTLYANLISNIANSQK